MKKKRELVGLVLLFEAGLELMFWAGLFDEIELVIHGLVYVISFLLN